MRITMALLVASSVLLAGCSSSGRRSASQAAAPRYVSAAPAPRVETGTWDSTLQQHVYVRDLSSPRGQRVVVRQAARPAARPVARPAARPASRLTQACTSFTPPAPPPLPTNACVVANPCPPTPCVPTPCVPTAVDDCPGGNCGIPSYADPCPGGVCGIPSPAAIVRSLPNPFCK